MTGLNVQIPKKVKPTAAPCAISPVLLECPEQDCSKKYKNPNGLKYHQSHAHGAGSMDEDSQQQPESPRVQPESPATPQAFQSAGSQPATPSAPSAAETASVQRSRTPTPQPQPLADAAPCVITPTQPSPATPLNTASSPTPPIPSAAGGSITTGVAAAAMQLQEPTPMETDASGALPLVAPHPPNSTDSIVQTPTKSDDRSKSNYNLRENHGPLTLIDSFPAVKPGVLRFVPTPGPEPAEPSRLPPLNNSPLTSLTGTNAIRVQSSALLAPAANLNASAVSQLNQPVSMVKTQKKQRKENNEFDGVSRERDDVQSPAYSDISDDSTPVAETDMSGNFGTFVRPQRDTSESAAFVAGMYKDKVQVKHPSEVMPKKGGEAIPPQSQMPMAGYGMFPFYPSHQQPYLVSQQQTSSVMPGDHPGSKQPPPPSAPTNPAPDYSKIKDPPLDLMTKPQGQPIDASPTVSMKENLPHSVTPPTMSQAKYMGNYYSYK